MTGWAKVEHDRPTPQRMADTFAAEAATARRDLAAIARTLASNIEARTDTADIHRDIAQTLSRLSFGMERLTRATIRAEVWQDRARLLAGFNYAPPFDGWETARDNLKEAIECATPTDSMRS